MTDKPFKADSFQALWQSMPTEPVVITPYEMRMRAAVFEGRVRRRNRIEFIASAIVASVFCWYATWPGFTILWPIANIMTALAAIYVAFNLHKRGQASATPDGGTVSSLAEFQRKELIRQRDALRSVGTWYLLPFVPGMLLWFVAMWIGRGPQAANPAAFAAGLVAVFVLSVMVFLAIFLLNLLGAARLQRMIDDLDRYKEKT